MADKKKPPSYAIGVKKKDGSYKWIPFSKAPKSLISEIAQKGFNTGFNKALQKAKMNNPATKKSNAK